MSVVFCDVLCDCGVALNPVTRVVRWVVDGNDVRDAHEGFSKDRCLVADAGGNPHWTKMYVKWPTWLSENWVYHNFLLQFGENWEILVLKNFRLPSTAWCTTCFTPMPGTSSRTAGRDAVGLRRRAVCCIWLPSGLHKLSGQGTKHVENLKKEIMNLAVQNRQDVIIPDCRFAPIGWDSQRSWSFLLGKPFPVSEVQL